jgi:hypothetical protein
LVYQDLGKPIIAYEAAAVYRLLWLVLWEATLLAVSLLLKQQKQEWQYWQIHYQKAAQVPMFACKLHRLSACQAGQTKYSCLTTAHCADS